MAGCTESEIKNVSDTVEKVAEEVEDQSRNITDSQDSHVLGVKNGHLFDVPDQTYGEAFENFFSYPKWKYFVGTKEGTDEDGDGKPDYEEKNVDIVEFTGYCTYLDTEVKALLEFTLDGEEDTFEATYLSFNDVPQNMLMLYSLLDAVFTGDGVGEVDAGIEADTKASTEADTEIQGNKIEEGEKQDNSTDVSRDAFPGAYSHSLGSKCGISICFVLYGKQKE